MPDPVEPPKTPPAPEAPDPKALADENAKLKAELEKLKAGKSDEDPDLRDKARKEREAKDKDTDKTKKLESAIRFDMQAKGFMKENENLLPKEIPDLLAQADKETYSDAMEKADSLKSGMIQAFFAIQANVDLLTGGQKSALDDYLKLTKTGKQERAHQVYEMIFEPAFDKLKAIKRAEALNKGHGTGDDDAYKKRLISGSRKHYFGEKQ